MIVRGSMALLYVLIPILLAYFIGAVPFGLLVARFYGVADIRKEGSGNIGATNVWRVAGGGAALWVYLLDIGKGVMAILIARQFASTLLPHDYLLVLCAIAAVIGNIFPLYLGFKGGKGVNTSLGVMIMLLPVETLICLVVFLLVVFVFRFISLGSITAAVSLFLVVVIEKYLMAVEISSIYLYLTFFLGVMVIISHRQNIRRLLSGTENRFRFPSRADRAGSHV